MSEQHEAALSWCKITSLRFKACFSRSDCSQCKAPPETNRCGGESYYFIHVRIGGANNSFYFVLKPWLRFMMIHSCSEFFFITLCHVYSMKPIIGSTCSSSVTRSFLILFILSKFVIP